MQQSPYIKVKKNTPNIYMQSASVNF